MNTMLRTKAIIPIPINVKRQRARTRLSGEFPKIFNQIAKQLELNKLTLGNKRVKKDRFGAELPLTLVALRDTTLVKNMFIMKMTSLHGSCCPFTE